MALSAILQKLLFIKQFDITKGKIKIFGDKQIMLDASAILEMQEIDNSHLYVLGKRSSIENLSGLVAHAKMYDKVKDAMVLNIGRLGKKIISSDQGVLKTLQEVFNVYGLGEMVIQEVDHNSKKATVIVKNSTIAEVWKEKNRAISRHPVCTLTAGVVAGMFSFIFAKPVDCI